MQCYCYWPPSGTLLCGPITAGLRSLRSLRPAAKHDLPPSGAEATEDEITALLPYNYKKSQE